MQTNFFKKVLKSVNNKKLVDELSSFIEDGFIHLGVTWSDATHRASLVEVVEEYLEALAEDKKIDQFKVICDRRNNSIAQMDLGFFQFSVSFKQTNCLNTTQLLYTIETAKAHLYKTKPDYVI